MDFRNDGWVEELLGGADRNMWDVWIAVLASGPRPARVERDSLLLLSSGLPVAMFNPAYVTAPLSDPAGAVAQVTDHYAALGAPFALTFRDTSSPGMAAACEDAGLIEHWQAPLMVLDPVDAARPPHPVDGLAIEHLAAENLDGYAAVLAAGFDAPRGLVDMLFGRPLLQIDGLTGFVGLLDGEPVATSAAYVKHGVVGVYNVATMPQHRRKGLAAALTWAAAASDPTKTTAILQASGDGEPVYQRMGFETPARYRQFVLGDSA